MSQPFFEESMWDLGVMITLWLMRKHTKRKGDLFLWYMALYGCGRFLIEQLRTDSLYLFGFRVSQYLSLLLCVAVAVVFIVRFARQHKCIGLAQTILITSLAFIRPVIPNGSTSVELILSLYMVSIALFWLDRGSPLWARLWLVFDAAVYVTLLLCGLSHLWNSPYFLYAGLSIPPYLAITYSRLVAETAPTPLKEA